MCSKMKQRAWRQARRRTASNSRRPGTCRRHPPPRPPPHLRTSAPPTPPPAPRGAAPALRATHRRRPVQLHQAPGPRRAPRCAPRQPAGRSRGRGGRGPDPPWARAPPKNPARRPRGSATARGGVACGCWRGSEPGAGCALGLNCSAASRELRAGGIQLCCLRQAGAERPCTKEAINVVASSTERVLDLVATSGQSSAPLTCIAAGREERSVLSLVSRRHIYMLTL